MLYRYDDIHFHSKYIFIVINFKTRKGDFAGHCHQPLANYRANARAVLQKVDELLFLITNSISTCV